MATNIFISHIHEDENKLTQLKDLVKQTGFDVKDGSITSAKPNNAEHEGYIKSAILAPQIRWCSVLVVLISPETKHSDWVNWEIEYAESLGKRIVGVWDQGAAACDLPEALDKYADAIVGWQGERIRGAITGEINNKETPGDDASPARPLPRYTC